MIVCVCVCVCVCECVCVCVCVCEWWVFTAGLQSSGAEADSSTTHSRKPTQHTHLCECVCVHWPTHTQNSTLQNSGIEKAFLFDMVSKIYIATDR